MKFALSKIRLACNNLVTKTIKKQPPIWPQTHSVWKAVVFLTVILLGIVLILSFWSSKSIRTSMRLSAGWSHTCFINDLGRVLCWGNNGSGQLGDGTFTSRSAPVPVTGLDAQAIAISAGKYFTCALTTVGGVKCWGANDVGQLGNAVSEWSSPLPVTIHGLEEDKIQSISAGGSHACALTQTGKVKCWGFNGRGQLGMGRESKFESVTEITQLNENIISIAAGAEHTCALTRNGTVTCWGDNQFGQLGDGTNERRPLPVDVIGLPPAVAISAGKNHTCAISHNKKVYCWGDNRYGQLGNGATEVSSRPVETLDLIKVILIDVGGQHSCALTGDHRLACWGFNRFGQLGNGKNADSKIPSSVPSISRPILEIAAGGEHTCAWLGHEKIICWGSNSFGQLGNGSTAQQHLPVNVLP